MLHAPGLFFSHLRSTLLGPTLTQSEVEGANAILAAMEGEPIAFTAYALATAYHETAHSMQPIQEAGGAAYFTRLYDPTGRNPTLAHRLGNTKPGDGALYCGRGYVQCTGRANYEKAAAFLGTPLGAYPELALRPDIAAKIMRRGMDEGWFTGYSFSSFLPADRLGHGVEFYEARRIINGADRAQLIAGYATDFQKALQEGGWA